VKCQFQYGSGIVLRQAEQYTGRSFGFPPTLFPIPQRGNADSEGSRELRLGEVEPMTDVAYIDLFIRRHPCSNLLAPENGATLSDTIQ